MNSADSAVNDYPTRQFLTDLGKTLSPYRKRFWMGIAVAAVATGFDVMGPMLLKTGVDSLQRHQAVGWLWTIAGAIILAAALGGVFRYYMRERIIIGSRLVEADMRAGFFGHLLRLSPTFFDYNHTGDLMARAVEDIERVRMVIGPAILNGSNTLLTILFSAIMMFALDPVLALAVLTMAPFVGGAVFLIASRLHWANLRQQETYSNLSSLVQENLTGIRVVKSFAREDNESQRFLDLCRTYMKRSLDLASAQAVFFPSLGLVIGLGSAGILWVGGWRISQGLMTLGDFIAFMSYLALMTWPMIALGWMTHLFQRGSASAKRLDRILRLPAQFEGEGLREGDPLEKGGSESAVSDNITRATPLPPIYRRWVMPANEYPPSIEGGLGGCASNSSPSAPEITFDHVSLRFGENDGLALDDVSAVIPAGSTVAIVGAVGSGKSSLARLLPRLYPPSAGRILLDGQPIESLPVDELRGMIGYVDQTPFLFSASLRENISIGRVSPSDAEIDEAARAALFDRAVVEFPDGWETLLGERGVTLSGGQQQRLTLARALLIDPPVLILDDALSAVDSDTEAEILENLKSKFVGRTTLFITHRLAAAEKANRILVLKKGKLVEDGSHEELMARSGVYEAMYRRQRIAAELGAMQ